MKNFTNCIIDENGNIWCFDPDVQLVCKINVEYPNISKISQEILCDLLKAQSVKNQYGEGEV